MRSSPPISSTSAIWPVYTGSNGLVVVTADGATFMTDFRYANATRGDRSPRWTCARPTAKTDPPTWPSICRSWRRTPRGSASRRRTCRWRVHSGAGRPSAAELVPDHRHGRAPARGQGRRRGGGDPALGRAHRPGAGRRWRRRAWWDGARSTSAWRIRELFHQAGAEELSFDTIVAAVRALRRPPARRARGRPPSSPGTLVIIDLGCMLDGYGLRLHATFATGDARSDLREIYDVCLRQPAALRWPSARCHRSATRMQPGRDVIEGGRPRRRVRPRDRARRGSPDPRGPAAGRDVRYDAGAGVGRDRRTGHLRPGRAGVRIEDLVVVTEHGCERLTPFSKEFRVVG